MMGKSTLRWLAFSAFFFLALSRLAMGQTADTAPPFDEAEHAARMAEVTEQLIESSDPTQQAAGLLLSEHAIWAGWHTDDPILSETEFSGRLHALIDAADSALARALLAHLCASQGVQEDCIDRGLDDAIVRFDGADLVARLHLADADDANRVRQVIIQAQTLNERYMDYALLLLDAMDEHGGFVTTELAAAPLLHGLSLSPPFANFSRQCASPSPEDPELDHACERILDQMMGDHSSLLLTAIGSAVSAQRLQARGDSDAQARHEQWRDESNQQIACFGSASEAIWETADGQFVREFLKHWQAYGEASALIMVANQAGLDCGSLQPPPFRGDSIE